MKKWLSRGIVLAMVVAMMIPAPVLAKSSKSGGKLIKSVTVYTPSAYRPMGEGEDWDMVPTSWNPTHKFSYKYDKKKNEVSETSATLQTYLGIPVSGSAATTTTKYKYKGKKPKSATLYDSAGFVSEKQSYKNGRVVSWSTDRKTSRTEWDWEKNVFVEKADFNASVGHNTYFKNGLTKSSDATYSGLDSDGNSYAYTDNTVYSWVQKKGVPSLMYGTTVSTGKDWRGHTYDGTPETFYAVYNSRGLIIESGDVEDGKNKPDFAVQYTMKKGLVDTAVVYGVDNNGKPYPASMLKFKYTKTKSSKTRYFKDVNSFIGFYGGEN